MDQQETTHAERVQMIELHQRGKSLSQIAEEMKCNYYTVRKWWRKYRQNGWEGIEVRAKGPPLVGRMGRFSPLVKYVALRLKREHPGWGPDKLRLEMSRRTSLQTSRLPNRSTLAGYLAQFRNRLYRKNRPATKRPDTEKMQSNEPHQCWQVDFKGDVTIANGHLTLMPFMVCDEASGAPLAGLIHTIKAKGNRTGLTTWDVQADLRQIFDDWGLPDALRMDRDPLLVGDARQQWPGLLLLWLVGLGVQPIINRAYRPTDNAIIERNHRTWGSDVMLGQTYNSEVEVQAETDQAFADRRGYLPSRHKGCDRQPPVIAFPALNIQRRSYAVLQEYTIFDIKRVDAYLQRWEWRRPVDSQGKIYFADEKFFVGRQYHKQIVKILFDPQTRRFRCLSMAGTEIARLEVMKISQAYILQTLPENLGTT